MQVLRRAEDDPLTATAGDPPPATAAQGDQICVRAARRSAQPAGIRPANALLCCVVGLRMRRCLHVRERCKHTSELMYVSGRPVLARSRRLGRLAPALMPAAAEPVAPAAAAAAPAASRASSVASAPQGAVAFSTKASCAVRATVGQVRWARVAGHDHVLLYPRQANAVLPEGRGCIALSCQLR